MFPLDYIQNCFEYSLMHRHRKMIRDTMGFMPSVARNSLKFSRPVRSAIRASYVSCLVVIIHITLTHV
jgi:hypothetical protein